MYGDFIVFIDECRMSNTFILTHQHQLLFAAAHAIKVHHDLHRVSDAPPPAALAAHARSHQKSSAARCDAHDSLVFARPVF
eukprot:6193080-Pleurochrysis_carterae.AAC.1